MVTAAKEAERRALEKREQSKPFTESYSPALKELKFTPPIKEFTKTLSEATSPFAVALTPERIKLDEKALENVKGMNSNLKKAFPKVNLGLIHGRLSTDEKEKAMAAFASGEVRLLVCTTVIEVGIDIPEATVMLVEHADRFGLAQLHQLRGRIGRGPRPSWCFLVSTGRVTADAAERLKTMVATTNGFELAEKDLALRGPGELLGLRQHGAMEWEHLDLLNDTDELVKAREEAGKFVAADPELRKAEGRAVAAALKSRLGDAWDLVRAS